MQAEKQQRASGETRLTGPPPYPGTPRWVKVSGIVVGVLTLLAVIVMLAGVGGQHGPGRHMRSSDIGGHAAPEKGEP